MTQTRQKFKVVEFDGRIVWLQSQEGSKSGLQFGVKATNEQIKNLDVGVVGEMTVRSLNAKNTAWELVENHNSN